MDANNESNLRRLNRFFDIEEANRAASLDEIKRFLTLAGTTLHLTGLDVGTVADAFHASGFESHHLIAEMDMTDLAAVGMMRAHCKALCKFLGGKVPTIEALNLLSDSQSSHDAVAMAAAAAAAAVSSVQRVDKLRATDGLTTVKAVRQWAADHAEAADIPAPMVVSVIRTLRADPAFDLATTIADPAFNVQDASYAARVRSSLSNEQLEDSGVAVSQSAVELIKQVLLGTVQCKQELFNANYQKLIELGPTQVAAAAKDRFKTYSDRLTEVRYHSSFELKTAVKVLVKVVQTDAFLSSTIMSEWTASAKDQSALSAVLTTARKELAIPVAKSDKRPDRNNGNGSQSDSASKHFSRSGGSRGAPPPYSNSSSSASSKVTCNNFKKYGKCSYGTKCKFEHEGGGPPGIHQIVATQFDRQMKQMAKMVDAQNEMLRSEIDDRVNDMMGNDIQMMQQLAEDMNGAFPPLALPMVAMTTRAAARQVSRRKTPSDADGAGARFRQAREAAPNAMPVTPVIDGASSYDVCKHSDCKYAKTVTSLDSPVQFSTVSALGSADEVAHIGTALVDMPDSIVVKTAPDSLCTHKTIHDNGFDAVVYMPGKCALVKGSEVYGALADKGMFRLPANGKPHSDARALDAVNKARKYWMKITFERMKAHMRRAHRPKSTDCRTCLEALTDKPPSTRCAQDDAKSGSDRGLVVGMDYIVGLPTDKDGNTGVLVMVAASCVESSLYDITLYHLL